MSHGVDSPKNQYSEVIGYENQAAKWRLEPSVAICSSLSRFRCGFKLKDA